MLALVTDDGWVEKTLTPALSRSAGKGGRDAGFILPTMAYL
jgi:hypothetical protein